MIYNSNSNSFYGHIHRRIISKLGASFDDDDGGGGDGGGGGGVVVVVVVCGATDDNDDASKCMNEC